MCIAVLPNLFGPDGVVLLLIILGIVVILWLVQNLAFARGGL
jgi:hypothetical protein